MKLKMNKDHLKGFALGALSVILFSSLVGTAFAAASGKLMNIRVVLGGISLFVDEKPFVPKDVNGKSVEPMVYDGTTYLPLRAIATALGKEVSYDSKTSSVYIGKASGAGQIHLDTLTPYETNGKVLVEQAAAFSILDQTVTPFNRLHPTYRAYEPPVYFGGEGFYYDQVGTSYTYILNSKYRSIEGEFVIPFTTLGTKGEAAVQFYNVAKNGDESLIAEFETAIADEPVDVSVDLRGVEILRIVYDRDGSAGAFYNVTLTEME